MMISGHLSSVPLAPGRAGPAAGHIPALDGVRGLAILLVLGFHLTLYGIARPESPAAKVLHELAMAGWVGVDLFFVLSGFLITGILYDAKGGKGFFFNFYARRSLRIFPLYFGVLALVFGLLTWWLPGHHGLRALASESGWYWSYTANLLIARAGWPEFGALGHFWSLAVEEQFYLLWPFAVYALDRRRLIRLCVVCAVIGFCLRAGLHFADLRQAAYVLMPARMDSLAAGALVALLARRPCGLVPLRRHAGMVAGVCLGALALVAVLEGGLNPEELVMQTLGYSLLAALFASLLILTLTGGQAAPLGRLFGADWLRFFGRYSYGLYVFHHPLLFIAPAAFAAVLPEAVNAEPLARFLSVVLVAVLSTALAVLSWHLYEKQFLRLKDLFPYGKPTTSGFPAGVSVAATGSST